MLPLHGHRSRSFLHTGMEKCTISSRTKLGPPLKRLSPSPFYLPCPLFVWCHRGCVERLWPLKRCGIVLAQKRNPVIPFINTQKLEATTVEKLTIVSLWSWVPPFLQNSSAFPFRPDCSFMWRLPAKHWEIPADSHWGRWMRAAWLSSPGFSLPHRARGL